MQTRYRLRGLTSLTPELVKQHAELRDGEPLPGRCRDHFAAHAPSSETASEVEVTVHDLRVIARGAVVRQLFAFWPTRRSHKVRVNGVHAERLVITITSSGGTSTAVRIGSSGCLKPCRNSYSGK